MKPWKLFVILFAFSTCQQSIASESICPDRPPLPEGADDLRMYEEDFTLERALKSVNFLQDDFAERIWGENPVNDFSAWSGHYIGYANSLSTIQGALLKQNVLLELARLNELSLTSADTEKISESKKKLENATKLFCKFLDSASFVD